MLLLLSFTTREQIVPAPQQESSLKEVYPTCRKNRTWFILLLLTIWLLTLAMKGRSYVYYFNNFVDEALSMFITPV